MSIDAAEIARLREIARAVPAAIHKSRDVFQAALDAHAGAFTPMKALALLDELEKARAESGSWRRTAEAIQTEMNMARAERDAALKRKGERDAK